MVERIAIVGTCPSSRMLALGLPDDWKVWVCSPGNDDFPRVDLWFELHDDLDVPEERGRFASYLAWLNAQSFPVMAQRLDLIPRAKLFPHAQLVQEFGPAFFTSQPAWMLAFAIEHKPAEIALFGLDMAAQSEYHRQKPAVLHFAFLAQARGIKISAPLESEVLCPPPLYGYSLTTPMGRKLRVRQMEIQAQIADMERQVGALQSRLQHFRGVLDENDWTQQTWTGGLTQPQDQIRIQPRPQLVKEN